MADQTADQLQNLEVGSGEPSSNYKAPAQKTLEDISKLDADDPSLVKYKQALLGDMSEVAYDKNDPRKVIVTSVEIHSPELDKPKTIAINSNLSAAADKDSANAQRVKIKEGALFNVEVIYYVQHQIVSGLKYEQVVKCKGIKVDSDSVMIGSYGPRKENYTYKSPQEEAAKGMLARQSYNVKSKFIDDDKVCHVSWEWKFEISKDW